MWKSLFEHGRSEGRVDITAYLLDPTKCRQNDIAWMDRAAARTIAECQSVMEQLTAYRQALATRYAELETMPYVRVLRLERNPRYDGRKFYDLTITRRFDDGTAVEELRENYNGSERRKAFARFEELKKQYPGIRAEQDTERRPWER